MPRNRKQNETQMHKIYVLISSVGDEFFVGKTAGEVPYETYKNHAGLRNKTTKDLFLQAREIQKFPKMYLLEEVNVTPTTAYGYCVAWTKYFQEQGFTPLAKGKILIYTEELTEENETIYNCIKDVPIASVLSDEHLLISDYKTKNTKKAEPKNPRIKGHRVTLNLTADDHELISRKAREAKMSMSTYCQTMAINGYVTTINVWEYLEELRGFKRVLKQILLAILQHGKYYPADLSNILKLLQMVNDGQKKVVKSLEQQTEKLVGYKKLQMENRRLKDKIKELENELSRSEKSNRNLREDDNEENKN